MNTALTLNDAESPEKFKEFYGPNNKQMPLLIREGRVLLTVAGLMQRRLEVLAEGIPEEVRIAWWTNYFFTGDLFAGHPDGRFKIVLDSPLIKYLDPETPIHEGSIKLGRNLQEANLAYEILRGEKFSRDDLEELLNVNPSKKEAKANLILQVLARDQRLLDSYVEAAFFQANQAGNYSQIMRLYLPNAPTIASVQLWNVDHLSNSSFSSGGHVLRNDGRLVGVLEKQYSRN